MPLIPSASLFLKTISHPAIWGSITALYGGFHLCRKVRQAFRARQAAKHKLTDLRLPFEGEWHTYWGGDHPALNHHFECDIQRYGFDFVIPCPSNKPRSEMTTEPLTFKDDGKKNEDYYCFGALILAPHDGIVTCAVDGIDDNVIPGIGNVPMFYGNTLMLQHPEGGFISVLAHLKKGSLRVKEGERVSTGQPIAQCGNSGNSSEPHLHYHIQTKPGFEQGVAVKAFFAAVQVGQKGVRYHYSPVKGDRLSHMEDEALATPSLLPKPEGSTDTPVAPSSSPLASATEAAST